MFRKEQQNILYNNKSFFSNPWRIISYFFQIPIFAAFLVILPMEKNVIQANVIWKGLILLNLFLIPSVYGIYIYKNKIISDENISRREERVPQFVFITILYGVNFFITSFWNAPSYLYFLSENFFYLSAILTCITFFWKISIHVAGIVNFIILLSYFTKISILLFIPLVIMVAISRIKIKNHSLSEVLAGALVAFLVTYVLLLYK
ncbi:MAG: hypothetical protein US74_C0016G0014 [Parcubacteria group bacterium GW2011_GWA2_38_13]|nr:MAG: hypothetical protein US74_C0016G0014 [Parcubacteria group bacterium GW2011_GWA2_38_13]